MKHKNIGLLAIFLLTIFWGCNQKNESGKTVDLKPKEYYTEKYRPQFHFSPPTGWMNDPNGMVFYAGEYHLFYQYYPDSTVWGPMHWGHAVSKDMVSWENLPIALYPDSLGLIFSGSAVVDWKNTSGFGNKENPPLVAIFTYHNMEREKSGRVDVETQGIAYSIDKGRTWTKYENNPVLLNPGSRDFRDPSVIWHEGTQKWNLILSAHDRVKIYSSDNLKDWQPESEFGSDAGSHGGVWECPDLFPLKVNGGDQTKWVLIVNMNPGGPNGGSGTQYFVGDYDGHEFIADSKETSWLDYGRDNYAGVTWSDVPKEDGRRLFLGWMSNWDYANLVPTGVWRSAMTIPRELILEKSENNYVLASVPVDELKTLRNEEIALQAQVISGKVEMDTKQIQINRSEMIFQFQLSTESQFGLPQEFGITFSNEQGETFNIAYSPSENIFFTDRTNAGENSFSDNFAGKHTAKYKAGKIMEIRLFVDEASVEVFIDNGKLVMTDIIFPSAPYNQIRLFSTNGSIKLNGAEMWSLKSVW